MASIKLGEMAKIHIEFGDLYLAYDVICIQCDGRLEMSTQDLEQAGMATIQVESRVQGERWIAIHIEWEEESPF